MIVVPRWHLLFLACFLGAPVLGLGSAILVNGICDAGTCPVDTLGFPPDSTSGTFAFNTSVNADPFHIFGEFKATNPTSGNTTIQINATVVYEGNTPTTQTDVLTIDDLQNYTVSGGLSGNYFEDTAAGFGGILGAGSSLSAQLSYNGQGLGVLGPFTAPGYEKLTKDLTLTGTALAADFKFTFDFGAGSTNGSFITTTPEPEGVIPVAAILALGLGVPAIRRSRLRSKNMG